MRYLLLFLSLSTFAMDNYVSSPEASVVYADKKACEEASGVSCYVKPEDHTIMKIEGGVLVEDAAKKAAKEQAKQQREAESSAKLTGCSDAKLAIVTLGDRPKADDAVAAMLAFFKSCLM